MVGIDALSQQTNAVKQLSEHHAMPISAIHAPCLLFTQRVWGTEPWGKLERSAEMAADVGAEVVVVHPPFRWQRDYARDFVNGIAALENSTGIAFAVENMYPWRASSRRGAKMYAPGLGPLGGALRQHHHRPLARRDRRGRPDRDGRAARRPAAPRPPDRRQRLRQGRAPRARPRRDGCRLVPAPPRARPASPARSWSRSTPGAAAPRRSARPTCASRSSSRASTSSRPPRDRPVSTAPRRGRRPGAPDTRARS